MRRMTKGLSFSSRCVVILRVLVVIIFRQRRIDVVQNDAGHIDLAIVEQLQRFPRQARGGVGQPDDKKVASIFGARLVVSSAARTGELSMMM